MFSSGWPHQTHFQVRNYNAKTPKNQKTQVKVKGWKIGNQKNEGEKIRKTNRGAPKKYYAGFIPFLPAQKMV